MKKIALRSKSLFGSFARSPVVRSMFTLCLMLAITAVAGAQETDTLWTTATTEVGAAVTAIKALILALAAIPVAFFVYKLFNKVMGRS